MNTQSPKHFIKDLLQRGDDCYLPVLFEVLNCLGKMPPIIHVIEVLIIVNDLTPGVDRIY